MSWEKIKSKSIVGVAGNLETNGRLGENGSFKQTGWAGMDWIYVAQDIIF
jgi:hypothetical protein